MKSAEPVVNPFVDMLTPIPVVKPEAVTSSLEKYNVYQLIHGHTHRPAIHNITVDGHKATRYVLGDWREDSAMILHCTANGNNLINLYDLNGIN